MTGDGEKIANQEANARLIAAAPELLASNVTAAEGINTAVDHLSIWTPEQMRKHLFDLQEVLHRARALAEPQSSPSPALSQGE